MNIRSAMLFFCAFGGHAEKKFLFPDRFYRVPQVDMVSLDMVSWALKRCRWIIPSIPIQGS